MDGRDISEFPRAIAQTAKAVDVLTVRIEQKDPTCPIGHNYSTVAQPHRVRDVEEVDAAPDFDSTADGDCGRFYDLPLRRIRERDSAFRAPDDRNRRRDQ